MRDNECIADMLDMDGDSESILAARDRRVQEARKFNLLSNVFMSVALDDKGACQYVLRILTGIKDLEVKEVRSQYRISKSIPMMLYWIYSRRMAADIFTILKSSVGTP